MKTYEVVNLANGKVVTQGGKSAVQVLMQFIEDQTGLSVNCNGLTYGRFTVAHKNWCVQKDYTSRDYVAGELTRLLGKLDEKIIERGGSENGQAD